MGAGIHLKDELNKIAIDFFISNHYHYFNKSLLKPTNIRQTMNKKIFLLTLMFTNACYSMNYVSDLKNSLQESWREATLLTKSAIVGFTSYILFNEWRNRSRFRENLNLNRTKAEQEKQNKRVNSLLGALTGGLGTSCQEIEVTMETDNYARKDYTKVFNPEKFEGNVTDKYPETMDLIKKKAAGKLRGHLFDYENSPGGILEKRINFIAQILFGENYSWNIRYMNLDCAKLHLGITALERKCYAHQDALFNTARTLYGPDNEYVLYDSAEKNYSGHRREFWGDSVNDVLISENPKIKHLEMQVDTLNRTLFGDDYEVQTQIPITTKEDLEKETQFFSRHREMAKQHIGLAYQGFGDGENIKE